MFDMIYLGLDDHDDEWPLFWDRLLEYTHLCRAMLILTRLTIYGDFSQCANPAIFLAQSANDLSCCFAKKHAGEVRDPLHAPSLHRDPETHSP